MIIAPTISDYIDSHCSSLPSFFADLERETHLTMMMPNMLSGPTQGLFLKLMVELTKSKKILEIGTFTGYSALCMALGLPENGQLTTIDKDTELEEIIHKYIKLAKLEHKIISLFGDAKNIIPTLDNDFDFVFIDADKQGYSSYFDLVFPKIKIGGIILADNTLWKGKVIEPFPNKDTQALIDFNIKINEDNRVENIIIPIRDGLHLIRKIAS